MRSKPGTHVEAYAADLERYRAITEFDEGLIIYDELEEDAWIQSDQWVSLGERQ